MATRMHNCVEVVPVNLSANNTTGYLLKLSGESLVVGKETFQRVSPSVCRAPTILTLDCSAVHMTSKRRDFSCAKVFSSGPTSAIARTLPRSSGRRVAKRQPFSLMSMVLVRSATRSAFRLNVEIAIEKVKLTRFSLRRSAAVASFASWSQFVINFQILPAQPLHFNCRSLSKGRYLRWIYLPGNSQEVRPALELLLFPGAVSHNLG